MNENLGRSRRHKARLACLFVVLTSVAGLAALLIYPRVTYPARPSAVVVTAETEREVSWMSIQIAEETPDDGVLGIYVDLYAEGDLDDVDEERAQIVALVPTVVNDSLTCVGEQPCELSVYTSPYFNPYRQNRAYVEADWQRLDEASDYGSVKASVRLEATNFSAMGCSEYACRGSVPRLFVKVGTRLTTDAAASSYLALDGLMGYRWDSEYLAGDEATPYLQFTTPLDEATELAYLSRPGVDGENESALRSASDRLFISGALLGVAGGAFIAGLTELAAWVGLGPVRKRSIKS